MLSLEKTESPSNKRMHNQYSMYPPKDRSAPTLIGHAIHHMWHKRWSTQKWSVSLSRPRLLHANKSYELIPGNSTRYFEVQFNRNSPWAPCELHTHATIHVSVTGGYLFAGTKSDTALYQPCVTIAWVTERHMWEDTNKIGTVTDFHHMGISFGNRTS